MLDLVRDSVDLSRALSWSECELRTTHKVSGDWASEVEGKCKKGEGTLPV